MLSNRRRLAGICWAIAGLPILASFVQAAIALLGTSAAGIPIIGGLKRSLQAVAVFDAAGTIFRSSSTIVLVLFVLITLAWLAQGGGLFVLRHRAVTLGAAGFVTLFLVLFELVYLPLLSMGLPSGQVAGFVLIPLAAGAASWAAVFVFEWDVTLDEATAETLQTARADTQSARQRFDEQVESTVPESTRDTLRSFVPEAVDSLESECEQFRSECTSIVDRADSLTDEAESASSRHRKEQAEQVLADAEALDPETRASQICEEFERALVDEITDEFGDLHLVSRFDSAYEIRNIQQHNEVSLPSIEGPAVQIGGRRHELADRLVDALESDGIPATARAIEHSRAHLDDLESHLDRQERDVAGTLEDADEAIDVARERLDTLAGEPHERLSAYLLEGRNPDTIDSLPSVPAIQERATAAKTALHDGRFDDAKREASAARERARDLQEIAEFFANSVVATIEHGSGSIPIPTSIDTTLVSQLRVPFERSYRVDYTVDGDELEIASDASSATPDQTDERATTAATERDDVSSDDVLYVLRELGSTAASTSAENAVELQTERLPEKFVTSGVLDEVKRFAKRQPDVTSVTVPSDAPPGYISITVDESASPQRVMNELQDQFASSQH